MAKNCLKITKSTFWDKIVCVCVGDGDGDRPLHHQGKPVLGGIDLLKLVMEKPFKQDYVSFCEKKYSEDITNIENKCDSFYSRYTRVLELRDDDDLVTYSSAIKDTSKVRYYYYQFGLILDRFSRKYFLLTLNSSCFCLLYVKSDQHCLKQLHVK